MLKRPSEVDRGSLQPKKSNSSTLRIPFGPFVMLWPRMLSPLFVNVRKTWKKKSVTIAR